VEHYSISLKTIQNRWWRWMKFNTHPPVSHFRVTILSLNLFLLFLPITSTAQKEIEITSFYAKVYVAPSTNANFIGLTQKGERYPILGVRDNWYHIRFKNINGWVEFSQVTVYDPYAAATQETTEAVTDANASNTLAVATESTATSVGTTDRTSRLATTTSLQDTPRTAFSGAAPTQGQPRSVSQNRPSTQPRRYTTPHESKPAEKKESMLRSWFTQQKLPDLPPTIVPDDDQSSLMRYFQVKHPTRVLEFLNPQSPILGMSKKGQLLPLVSEGDSWCRVAFADTAGWIEKKYGRIIDPDATLSIDYVKVGLIFGGILVFVGLLAVLILVLVRRKKNITPENANKKHVVIIADSPKVIQYTLTNGTTTLERCFSEVGFSISNARDLTAFKDHLQQSQPDVVLIDYQRDSKIIASVERVCLPFSSTAAILFIVYNVPDPSGMTPGKVLPKMAFLGLTFSDRDVFKLVTPMLRADGEKIQKSVQSSALAGNIADGNLLEVLQFIEIGSKTGCLLIEMGQPFAIICFKNGRIIFAATADKIAGREAIFKVLDLKIGKFRFVLDKRPKESNVNLSTLEVLMEWAKAIDEAHGH
jgi:hypothetical protein